MTTAVATQQTAALQRFDSVAKLLQSDKVQAAIARALPRHMTAERMIRVAMTAIQKVPKLAECDQRSLVNAIVQASELGLEPNTPLQHAYLIPFWNKNTNRHEVQLMPGYRGFIALARRSGEIAGIYAEIVYEKDFFEITYGLNKDLVHKPALNEEDRGEMVGAYAVAKFKDGYTDFEYMDAIEIGKIRKRSQSPDKGPWATDTGEMWRKTPIRRLFKRLPSSVEDNKFEKAIQIDNEFQEMQFTPLGLGDGGGDSPEVITEEQRVALVEAAKASGQDLTAIVSSAGFELIAHITVDRYDELFAIASTSSSSPAEGSADVTVADAQDADAAESENNAPPIDAEESKLEDLRTAATELFRDLKGPDLEDAQKFLGTKAIKELTPVKLNEFLKKFGQ